MKVAVERAVRPLAATFARKRMLREELLAHLHSVYFDVLSDCSSEAEACERSLARFGDPRKLTGELQASVPRSDRLLSKVQGVPRPADFTPWGMFRWILVFTIAFNTVALALLTPLWWLEIGRPRSSPFYGLAVMAVCGIVVFYPFQLIAMRVGALSLERCLGWNRESLRLLLAASVCFPIWITLIYWGLAGELAIPWRTIWPAYGAGFVLGPLLAVVQGRRFVEDRRYIEQWALAIDD
jgi:hypothetical protein